MEIVTIYRRIDRDFPTVSYDQSSLKFYEKISMLAVIPGNYLYSWNDHITSVAKAAAYKLGFFPDESLFYAHYTRFTFAPASNRTRICWDRPPCIALLTWMQFRSQLSDYWEIQHWLTLSTPWLIVELSPPFLFFIDTTMVIIMMRYHRSIDTLNNDYMTIITSNNI